MRVVLAKPPPLASSLSVTTIDTGPLAVSEEPPESVSLWKQ
jgi:hypothetical protein